MIGGMVEQEHMIEKIRLLSEADDRVRGWYYI